MSLVFVIDAQLPPRLARVFVEAGHRAEHVAALGLGEARDHEIWRYAAMLDAIVVSKDEDFVQMAQGSPRRPALLWARIGNSSADFLCRTLTPHLAEIVAAFERGETIVELG